MDDQQRIRIITAVEFAGRSLLVQLVKFHRGDSALLHLRVRPRDKDDARVEKWRYGSNWTYPRVPPVWPLEDVDPWEEASFTGPLPSGDPVSDQQPCRSCGAVATDGANYCGQCGFPLDAVEALAALLAARAGEDAAGSSEAGAQIAALVERYAVKAAPHPPGRQELLNFIRADFTSSSSARFVRGEPATITPDLTLAVAQDIHQAVATTGRVRPDQIQHAELLLRYAPLRFGYWGPFKALIKSVPVDDLADAYADALARLSSKDWSRQAPPTVHIEDVSFLGDVFPAASPDTLKYLARRVRRDLATLAERSPDTYAQVATRMILSWDRDLSRNSFAPAYVMLGARKYLDQHSENVAMNPDMTRRRDAHPDIWNDRPELVQEIFDGVINSTEAQTWSYQVLESLGQAPALTGDHLKLALQSRHVPLNLAASQALASRPGLWDSLTVPQWVAFFRDGDEASNDRILDAMSVGTIRPAAVNAAREFLASDPAGSPLRMLAISVMFLTATQPSPNFRTIFDRKADTAAVAAVISQSATKHGKLWKPVIKTLDLAHLQKVRLALPNGTSKEALDAIDKLLLEKRAESADPSAALDWIVSSNPAEAKLGWELLDRGYGIAGLIERLPRWISRRLPDPSTVERIIPQVLARAKAEDAPELANVVREALGRGVSPAKLLELLTKTALGHAVIWRTVGPLAGSDFVTLLMATPTAVQLVGDSIGPDQLASASNEQLTFALQYVNANPARIAGDAAFGLAAATRPQLDLRIAAIRQLQLSEHMPQVWLALAESPFADARSAARDHLATLDDGRAFGDAVLACMDSGSSEVWRIGSEVLNERLEHSEDRSFWNALAECDDPRIEDRVATVPKLAERVDEQVLSDFDQRVLLTHRRFSRDAKESVKARLEATHADSGMASPQRVAALLDLARGQTLKDKEWALQKLAELALDGVEIDGLEVSLVTTGDES